MSRPGVIRSAGGAVIAKDHDGHRYIALVQGSGGSWRLPKGHLEKSETLKDAALREIAEEIGLSSDNLVLGRYLGSFELNEFEPSGPQHKLNHFFVAYTTCSYLPPLQADSEHLQAAWFRLPLVGVQIAYDYQKILIDKVAKDEVERGGSKMT